MSFERTVVRHNDENGRKKRRVVKYGTDVQTRTLKNLFDVVTFEDQEDGTIHIVGKNLIIEVFVEVEDPKYGTFSKLRSVNF